MKFSIISILINWCLLTNSFTFQRNTFSRTYYSNKLLIEKNYKLLQLKEKNPLNNELYKNKKITDKKITNENITDKNITDKKNNHEDDSDKEYDEEYYEVFEDDIEDEVEDDIEDEDQEISNEELMKEIKRELENNIRKSQLGIRIIYPTGQLPEQLRSLFQGEGKPQENQSNEQKLTIKAKSENFEVLHTKNFNFSDVGGYNSIKEELLQCADILVNYTKYAKYNVRTPKGLILEGPPGNGKTMISKAFAGEINVGFIAVSGSQFQEKYVGVGASRIRELFKLANNNKPCIIFMDEMDALGRKRSNDNEASTSERDTTLNELLVQLDGFKENNGIFVIGATNRVDLLDDALIRPGRIDKQIYVGNPDKKTRTEILGIHIKGKPYDDSINMDYLVQLTSGFSGAQIENFLNEGMLYALRNNRDAMTKQDLEIIANRILTGFQSNEHKLSQEMIFQVAVHEMGHALAGIFTNYKKLIKVTINLWSPKSLGFTLFEPDDNDLSISTKDKLKNELIVLLGGRIAEEIFFGDKISSGALKDLEQVRNLIQKMVLELGMGNSLIIPYNSDRFREKIDMEIEEIYNNAYKETKFLLSNSKQLIREFAELLLIEHEITREQILSKLENKYNYLFKK